jgi:hypothetical protein
MTSFTASNTHMSAVHGLIPGGAHTYAFDAFSEVVERGHLRRRGRTL